MAQTDAGVLLRKAQRAAALSLGATVAVVAVKFVAAYFSHSISVLSEGLQSTMDIFMSFLALVTLRYVARPPDEDHPYGHGKAELITSAFQMIVVIGSGVFIIWQAYRRYQEPQAIEWNWGAAAMIYTLASNSMVGFYLRRVAKTTQSPALESEAMHLKGDTLACVGVLVGMVLVGMTGWMVLDPAFAAIFAVVAMVVAARQLRAVLHPLMDGALPPEEIAALERVLEGHPQVKGYHKLRTRKVGSTKTVELHMMLDDSMSFVDAHAVTEEVETELRGALGGANVNIHYEPYEVEVRHQAGER